MISGQYSFFKYVCHCSVSCFISTPSVFFNPFSTLSLDFGNIISINDSGGTVLLSYRIYDDDAIYKGLANEQGNASANTHGINTWAFTPDAYNSINLASNNLSNLEFTFDRDYSGSFYIEFQVVETLNNRFVSSDTPGSNYLSRFQGKKPRHSISHASEQLLNGSITCQS